MPKRSRKPLADSNELAASIVGQATSGVPVPPKPEKDPAAVSLGRKGGLKGGKARAEKLSKERLSEIARQGAKARWRKPR